MMVSYYAIFFKENNGYWLKFPDLPGCFSCGEDLVTAKAMGKEAMELYLHGMDVKEIPQKTEPPYNDFGEELIALIEIELEVVEGKLQSAQICSSEDNEIRDADLKKD